MSREFLERVESELHGLALKSTDGAADLTIEHTVKDQDGEETFDTISNHPGNLADTVQAAEISINSESANFAVLFTLHKDNPFENMLVVISSGEKARSHCLSIHDTLVRALSAFVQSEPEGTAPKSEAKSFSLDVPSIEISEPNFLDLERHLIRIAATHTRQSPSAVANELRVTLKHDKRTEAFSSISQRGDKELPVRFDEIVIKLWSWGDERKYNADIKLCASNPDDCSIEIDCEGDGSRSAADSSRVWLENWLKKCGNENSRWHISSGRHAVLLMVAMFSMLGGLVALAEHQLSAAIIVFGVAALAIAIMKYGPHVWPHVRLTHPKEERRHAVVAGRFKAIVGTFLIATVIVPTLLQILQSAY